MEITQNIPITDFQGMKRKSSLYSFAWEIAHDSKGRYLPDVSRLVLTCFVKWYEYLGPSMEDEDFGNEIEADIDHSERIVQPYTTILRAENSTLVDITGSPIVNPEGTIWVDYFPEYDAFIEKARNAIPIFEEIRDVIIRSAGNNRLNKRS